MHICSYHILMLALIEAQVQLKHHFPNESQTSITWLSQYSTCAVATKYIYIYIIISNLVIWQIFNELGLKIWLTNFLQGLVEIVDHSLLVLDAKIGTKC